jgi:hypothetical protein
MGYMRSLKSGGKMALFVWGASPFWGFGELLFLVLDKIAHGLFKYIVHILREIEESP